MAITREDVLHLADLSNISLSEDQIEPLMKDLDNIVGYISQLDELDTEGVEPTYQCFDMQNVWREDVIEDFEANREDLLELFRSDECVHLEEAVEVVVGLAEADRPDALSAEESDP